MVCLSGVVALDAIAAFDARAAAEANPSPAVRYVSEILHDGRRDLKPRADPGGLPVTFTSALIALSLLGLAPPPLKEPPEPDCVVRAKALMNKVEELPMHARARTIDLAIRRDLRILCHVVDQAFFSMAPEAPAGCNASAPASCKFPGGLPVAPKLAGDVDPVLYLRVELIAQRLRAKKRLSDAHERLLSTLLLGSAVQKEHDREHAR